MREIEIHFATSRFHVLIIQFLYISLFSFGCIRKLYKKQKIKQLSQVNSLARFYCFNTKSCGWEVKVEILDSTFERFRSFIWIHWLGSSSHWNFFLFFFHILVYHSLEFVVTKILFYIRIFFFINSSYLAYWLDSIIKTYFRSQPFKILLPAIIF